MIFSIHQPRYAIFKFFDNIILLSHGQLVYHGAAQQALNHFKELGSVEGGCLFKYFICH